MTPAVQRALAYCYATGSLPTHIHLDTWSKAHDHCALIEDLDERVRSGRMYEIDAAGLKAIDGHPVRVAVDKLLGQGFKVDRSRGTSHYVAFTHSEDRRYALAYRSGGGSITTPVFDGTRWIRNETVHF